MIVTIESDIMSKHKHPEDPVCGECGEDLNTSNPHNWRCENEDCDAYHMGDHDIGTRDGGSGEMECPECGETMYWTRRTSHWECDECDYSSND